MPKHYVTRLAAALGTGQGAERLYDAYGPGLYEYCWAMLADPTEAAGALTDTVLVAAAHADALADPADLTAWLYALSRTESLRRTPSAYGVAGGGRAGGGVFGRWASGPYAAGPYAAGETDDVLTMLVARALSGLSPADRELLELSVRHRLSARQLAHVLGLAEHEAAHAAESAVTRFDQTLSTLFMAASGRLAVPREFLTDRPPLRVLLDLLPPARPPADLQANITAACTDPALSHYRDLVARRALPLTPAGFPRPPRPPTAGPPTTDFPTSPPPAAAASAPGRPAPASPAPGPSAKPPTSGATSAPPGVPRPRQAPGSAPPNPYGTDGTRAWQTIPGPATPSGEPDHGAASGVGGAPDPGAASGPARMPGAPGWEDAPHPSRGAFEPRGGGSGAPEPGTAAMPLGAPVAPPGEGTARPRPGRPAIEPVARDLIAPEAISRARTDAPTDAPPGAPGARGGDRSPEPPAQPPDAQHADDGDHGKPAAPPSRRTSRLKRRFKRREERRACGRRDEGTGVAEPLAAGGRQADPSPADGVGGGHAAAPLGAGRGQERGEPRARERPDRGEAAVLAERSGRRDAGSAVEGAGRRGRRRDGMGWRWVGVVVAVGAVAGGVWAGERVAASVAGVAPRPVPDATVSGNGGAGVPTGPGSSPSHGTKRPVHPAKPGAPIVTPGHTGGSAHHHGHGHPTRRPSTRPVPVGPIESSSPHHPSKTPSHTPTHSHSPTPTEPTPTPPEQ